MTWRMKDPRKVQHDDGHSIELIEGTWQDPYEIKPHFINNAVDRLTIPRLVREGLKFAAINTVAKAATRAPKAVPFPKRKSNRPTLSLKRQD